MVCLKFKFKKSINNIILCITVVLSKKKKTNHSSISASVKKKIYIYFWQPIKLSRVGI